MKDDIKIERINGRLVLVGKTQSMVSYQFSKTIVPGEIYSVEMTEEQAKRVHSVQNAHNN